MALGKYLTTSEARELLGMSYGVFSSHVKLGLFVPQDNVQKRNKTNLFYNNYLRAVQRIMEHIGKSTDGGRCSKKMLALHLKKVFGDDHKGIVDALKDDETIEVITKTALKDL